MQVSTMYVQFVLCASVCSAVVCEEEVVMTSVVLQPGQGRQRERVGETMEGRQGETL